jgi:hypothetical protein
MGMTKALFIWLIIRLFQFVFLAGTIFFSHIKSTNSVFQPAYQHSRTGPKVRPGGTIHLANHYIFLAYTLLSHIRCIAPAHGLMNFSLPCIAISTMGWAYTSYPTI